MAGWSGHRAPSPWERPIDPVTSFGRSSTLPFGGSSRPPALPPEIEIPVLRDELQLLRRNHPRPRFEPADRAWLCPLSGLLAKDRWSALLSVLFLSR